MKLFRHGAKGVERPGILDPGGVRRDLGDVIRDLEGDALGPETLERLRRLDLSQLPVVADDVRLGACVARVGNFVAVGLNYVDHALESGFAPPAEPVLFNKAPSSIGGPDDDVAMPPGSEKLDWEVELAVVIGRPAYRVDAREAPAVIAGFAVCNDLSERSFQLDRGGQWTKGKSAPGFGPLGPFLVTADEIADAGSLRLWLDVNGVRRQDATTADMIFNVNALIAYISQFMALEPGDVIATGTPPGVGLGMKPPQYLKRGDVIELGVEGLGRQRQRII